jgi:hypothetical protein
LTVASSREHPTVGETFLIKPDPEDNPEPNDVNPSGYVAGGQGSFSASYPSNNFLGYQGLTGSSGVRNNKYNNSAEPRSRKRRSADVSHRSESRLLACQHWRHHGSNRGSLCNQGFEAGNGPHRLFEHTRRVHKHFRCIKCLTRFSNEQEYNSHAQKGHRHPCSNCSARCFSTRELLSKHKLECDGVMKVRDSKSIEAVWQYCYEQEYDDGEIHDPCRCSPHRQPFIIWSNNLAHCLHICKATDLTDISLDWSSQESESTFFEPRNLGQVPPSHVSSEGINSYIMDPTPFPVDQLSSTSSGPFVRPTEYHLQPQGYTFNNHTPNWSQPTGNIRYELSQQDSVNTPWSLPVGTANESIAPRGFHFNLSSATSTVMPDSDLYQRFEVKKVESEETARLQIENAQLKETISSQAKRIQFLEQEIERRKQYPPSLPSSSSSHVKPGDYTNITSKRQQSINSHEESFHSPTPVARTRSNSQRPTGKRVQSSSSFRTSAGFSGCSSDIYGVESEASSYNAISNSKDNDLFDFIDYCEDAADVDNLGSSG